MKKIKYIVLVSVFSLGMTSCGDLGDLSIGPEHLNKANVPLEMVFSNAQYQALGSDWDMQHTGCIYSARWTQQLTSIDWWDGYGRYNYSGGYPASFWDTLSGNRDAMRDVTTYYDKWENQKGLEIDWNMTRAMRIYVFAKMSDLYDDIPHAEAGRPKELSYPKYDSQESMYKEMPRELDEAQVKLASGKAAMGVQDLYYKGDAAQWKKFANSLILRLAIRLVKVGPTTAKTYATKTYANGVIADVADNAKLDHAGGVTINDSSEPFAKINASEDGEFFLSETFVDMLKQANDPRLSLIGTTASEKDLIPVQDGWQEDDSGNMTAEKQEGILSGGYSLNPTSPYAIAKVDPRFGRTPENVVEYKERKADDGSVEKEPVYWYSHYTRYFSAPNRCTYGGPTAPTFIITAVQTNFLSAEAAIRGYISDDAKTFYENGVKAAFKQFTQFPNAGKMYNKYLPKDAVEKYLKENPFDVAKALEQISTQYCITTLGDPHKTFVNWRRSGFPVLTPAAMAKQGGQCAADGSIPCRFRYPSSESQVNKANYDVAVSRQSGDTFSTRVQWDKQ